jgi:hypothetical protein
VDFAFLSQGFWFLFLVVKIPIMGFDARGVCLAGSMIIVNVMVFMKHDVVISSKRCDPVCVSLPSLVVTMKATSCRP